MNTAAPGTTAGLASVVRSEVATRELGGASFFGQPANTSEKDKRNKAITKLFIRARKAKRNGSLLGINRKLHRNRGKRKNLRELLLTPGKRAPLWNPMTCHRFCPGQFDARVLATRATIAVTAHDYQSADWLTHSKIAGVGRQETVFRWLSGAGDCLPVMYARVSSFSFGIFHYPSALGTDSNNPQQVLGHLEPMFCRHRVLNRFQLRRKELDDPAALGTDHVVVVLVFVIVFVVSDAVAKTNFAREPGFGQEFQRAIDCGLPDARVSLPNQAIKIFAGEVRFRAQEDVENQVTLRRALESLLLNMFEKNFLLFRHSFGDLQFRIVRAIPELILHSEPISVKTGRC